MALLFAAQLPLGISLGAPQVLQNITVPVPVGTESFPKTHTLCLPSSVADIVVFFFGNYVIHAASIKANPGETTLQTSISVILALLVPTTGIIRAFDAIFRHARTEKGELQRAARAGALCTVVRTNDWKPRPGDVVEDVRILKDDYSSKSTSVGPDDDDEGANSENEAGRTSKERMALRVAAFRSAQEVPDHMYSRKYRLNRLRKIHGALCFPDDGYDLEPVPRRAKVCAESSSKPDTPAPEQIIASTNSVLKSLAALVQAIYAGVTLYRAKGSQLDRYGFASYGLTVTPYVIMSIINFLAHVLTPDYTALYLVRSDVMEEAERRGGLFGGVVGRLCPADKNMTLYECSFHDDHGGPEAKPSDPPAQASLVSNRPARHSDGNAAPTSGLSVQITYPPEAAPTEKRKLMIPYCCRFAKALGVDNLPEDWESKTSWVLGIKVFGFTEFLIKTFMLLLDSCLGIPAVKTQGRFRAKTPTRTQKLRKPDGMKDIVRNLIEKEREDFEECHGQGILIGFLSILIGCLTLIVIGVMSKFHKGDSTKAQRAWTMSWLAVTILMGPWFQRMFLLGLQYAHNLRHVAHNTVDITKYVASGVYGGIVLVGVFFAAPIGGYVVVGQMLSEFGNCVRLY